MLTLAIRPASRPDDVGRERSSEACPQHEPYGHILGFCVSPETSMSRLELSHELAVCISASRRDVPLGIRRRPRPNLRSESHLPLLVTAVFARQHSHTDRIAPAATTHRTRLGCPTPPRSINFVRVPAPSEM